MTYYITNILLNDVSDGVYEPLRLLVGQAASLAQMAAPQHDLPARSFDYSLGHDEHAVEHELETLGVPQGADYEDSSFHRGTQERPMEDYEASSFTNPPSESQRGSRGKHIEVIWNPNMIGRPSEMNISSSASARSALNRNC